MRIISTVPVCAIVVPLGMCKFGVLHCQADAKFGVLGCQADAKVGVLGCQADAKFGVFGLSG